MDGFRYLHPARMGIVNPHFSRHYLLPRTMCKTITSHYTRLLRTITAGTTLLGIAWRRTMFQARRMGRTERKRSETHHRWVIAKTMGFAALCFALPILQQYCTVMIIISARKNLDYASQAPLHPGYKPADTINRPNPDEFFATARLYPNRLRTG